MPFFFLLKFHTLFGEQIAIFSQIFESVSSIFFFQMSLIYKGAMHIVQY